MCLSRIVCVVSGLCSLLLSSPTHTAAGCIAESPDVSVSHLRFADGPPAYVFRLTNRSTASVYVLIIGEGGGPSLRADATNVPTSMGTPDGWKGRHVVDDGGKFMHYVWVAEEVMARIRPTMSVSGFSVQLPIPTRDVAGHLGNAPFKVFLADGTCHAGNVVADD